MIVSLARSKEGDFMGQIKLVDIFVNVFSDLHIVSQWEEPALKSIEAKVSIHIALWSSVLNFPNFLSLKSHKSVAERQRDWCW